MVKMYLKTLYLIQSVYQNVEEIKPLNLTIGQQQLLKLKLMLILVTKQLQRH